MDIRAKHAGTFVEGSTEAGGEIQVGALLYKIDTDSTGSTAKVNVESKSPVENKKSDTESKPPVESKSPVASSGARREVSVPSMGESITQGVLAEWIVKSGSVVNADDILARIDTDKVRGL